MNRNEFRILMTKTFGYDIKEFLCYCEGGGGILPSYIITNDEGDIFIMNKITFKAINWYKPFHIGRALASNLTEHQWEGFLEDLYKEWKEDQLLNK